MSLNLQVLATAELVAQAGAALIAREARAAVSARGRFLLAVSGGKTPGLMLRALAHEEVPWHAVHLFQVDERIAPANHPDRNLNVLREELLAQVPLPAEQFYPLPVEAPDLAAATKSYGAVLNRVAGTPAILDLVHLGLGPDGHTASLVPGDAALAVTDADVTVSGPYQGRRRMTLTYPLLNRSRRILWLVTGSEKATALRQLLAGDTSQPASHIARDPSLILADRAAAEG